MSSKESLSENMNSSNYRQALEQARRDLAHAIQQRDFWNLRIVQAQSAVRSMSAMLSSVEVAEEQERETQRLVGIAQAIEALVNSANHPITSTEVREGLILYGYDIDRYQNPVSIIHQTLQRLAVQGRIRQWPDGTFTKNLFYQALLNAGM
jgi:hypothetical protein